ncbi:MAG: hypothetical protein NT103_02440 [Campylobacterales bacterium]|nr:hypothetical protein [Campylobacterales bacterium]
MKHKLKAKIQKIVQNPKTKKAFLSMKPEKSLWGFFGIILFFIVPEIIAFIWGVNITSYANSELLIATSMLEQQYYKLLIMLFEDGGSWTNLVIGTALLIWLFF